MTVPLPAPSRSDAKKPLLADNVYLWLKNTAMVVLPAVGSLYLAVATIWGLPGAEKVVASCAAAATFLGVIAKLGERSYDKSDASNNVGVIRVNPTEDGTMYQLDLGDTDPAVIDRSGKVVFDVDSPVSAGR